MNKTSEKVVRVRVYGSMKKVKDRVYRYFTKFLALQLYVPKHVKDSEFVVERYEDEKFSTIVYVIRPKGLRTEISIEESG